MPAAKKNFAKPAAVRKRALGVPAPSRKPGRQTIVRKARSGLVTRSVTNRGDAKLFSRIVSGDSLAGIAAVNLIREGYSARMLKAASSFFGVPDARIQNIARVPASTASRLEKSQSRIDPAATERVYRMGTVARLAIEVFENEASAIEWMRQPNRALGNAAPLDLMDTEPGAVSVRQLLNAIATGGVA